MNTTNKKIESLQTRLINNIINKLNIYMQRNKQNLFSLANSFGFAYQPFYRLIKHRSVPTFPSLAMIACNLNCSLEELISDDVFIDIPVIEDISQCKSIDKCPTIRFYIPYEQYQPCIDDNFFAMRTNEDTLYKAEHYKIYIFTKSFSSAGEFMVSYKSKVKQQPSVVKIKHLNVVAVGSEHIYINNKEDNSEEKSSTKLYTPIAKVFSDALVVKGKSSNHHFIRGVRD